MMSNFEEKTELLEKRLTRLEHGAQQPRLAMEADGQSKTKTRERTEGAATAVQAMRVCACFLPIYSGHQVRWTYQGMAFLHAGLNPAQTPTRPVSA